MRKINWNKIQVVQMKKVKLYKGGWYKNGGSQKRIEYILKQ